MKIGPRSCHGRCLSHPSVDPLTVSAGGLQEGGAPNVVARSYDPAKVKVIEAERPAVLLVGLGWPVPTFIGRRIQTLRDLEFPVTVVHDRRSRTGPRPRAAGDMRETERVEGFARVAARGVLRPGRLRGLISCLPSTFREKLYFLCRHPYLLAIPRPDLVHLQWVGSAEVWSGVARALGVPLVASARGSQVTLEPYDPAKRAKIQRCLAAVDAVHCVSEDIRRRCEELGAPPERLFVNYNGIDTERFAPVKDSGRGHDDPDVFQLVTVGALIVRKNVMAQLTTLRALRDEGVPARLTIVGGGPDELVLKHAASALGLADTVYFAGPQSEDGVIKHLRSADAYLSTSVAEGLANSVLEAAACGLPVVAFECEGMREVVRDGVSGYVLPFGDLAGMVERLKALALAPELRRAFGTAGRKWVCARFEARACAEAMVKHYRRIVSQWARAWQ